MAIGVTLDRSLRTSGVAETMRSSIFGRIKAQFSFIVNFRFWKMKTQQNIIGPQVRALRLAQKMTQGELAARIGALGWDVSENTITKIETSIRCVTDAELMKLARALKTKLKVLLPGYESLF